jgi:hypothetical protein
MDYSTPNGYTQQDWINAGIYAKFKLNKVKSENEEFKAAFPGTGWVVNKDLQSINCPASLVDCPNVFGRCKFMTKQACLEQSGDFKEQGQGKKPYLEWREPGTEQGGSEGKCVFGNFALRNWCENPPSRRAGQKVRGVTDVPPFKYDQEQGQCLMTKDYCKYMGVDFKDGVPPDCKVSEAQKWLEKFTGKTLFRGIKRGLFTKFIEDIAITGIEGPFGYYELYKGISSGKFRDDLGLGPLPDPSDSNTKNGDVKENFEMKKTVDETILSDIQREITKNITKNKGNTQNITKDPPIVSGIIDDLYISEKKLLINNFAGNGINLYQLYWKPGINGPSMGFIASEIIQVFPQLIRKIKGTDHIIILPELTKENNSIRRMYYCYLNNEWFSGFIGNGMLLDILMRKNNNEKISSTGNKD